MRSYLLVAEVEFCGGEDVGERPESMEQHGDELDDEDQGEEEHEDQTDGFELQIFLADVHLERRDWFKSAGEARAVRCEALLK